MLVKLLTCFWGWTLILSAQTTAAADLTDLTGMTLNLHGYHPTGESERIFEDRSGKKTRAPSDIYSFTWDEITRGHARRLDLLSNQLTRIQPDLIFLQEVGAGGPQSSHDCSDFYREFPNDNALENTAARLQRRLGNAQKPTRAILACRGNLGWITDPQTFSEKRILKADPVTGKSEVVFDFHSSPYPRGMIVEGMAMLISPRIQVLWQNGIHVPIAGGREDHFFQAALLSVPGMQGSTLAVNVHLGHKLRNFEHSVAILQWIQNARKEMNAVNVIIGGDFNGTLLSKPSKFPETHLSMLPWEVVLPGRFDFRLPPSPQSQSRFVQGISNQLFDLNFHPDFKPWASIQNENEVRERIRLAIEKWKPIWSTVQEPIPFFQESALNRTSPLQSRVDYWLSSGQINATDFKVFNENTDDFKTDSLSDHPFIFTRWQLRRHP